MLHKELYYAEMIDERIENDYPDFESEGPLDFYELIHEIIDNLVIYTHECKQIIDDLDFDIFQKDHDFGQFESYSQAAFAALWDNYLEHGKNNYV